MYDHLAGRGMHELRTDELVPYIAGLAMSHGPASAEFTEALTWIVSELERKTNDERVIARSLAEMREKKKAEGEG